MHRHMCTHAQVTFLLVLITKDGYPAIGIYWYINNVQVCNWCWFFRIIYLEKNTKKSK